MKKRICPVCGKKSDSRLESCPYCGAVFPTSGAEPGEDSSWMGDPWDRKQENPARQAEPAVPKEKPGKKKSPSSPSQIRKVVLFVIFALIFAALACIGAWSDSEEEGTSEEESSPDMTEEASLEEERPELAAQETSSEPASSLETGGQTEAASEQETTWDGNPDSGELALGDAISLSDGVAETLLHVQKTDSLKNEQGEKISPAEGNCFWVFTFLDTAQEGKADVLFYDLGLETAGTECERVDDSESISQGGIQVSDNGFTLESGMSALTDLAFEVPEDAGRLKLSRPGTWYIDLDDSDAVSETFDASSVKIPEPKEQKKTDPGTSFRDAKGLIWTYDGYSLEKEGSDPEKTYLCLKFSVSNQSSEEVEPSYYTMDYRICCDGLMLRPDDVSFEPTEDGYENLYFADDIGAGETEKISLGLAWNPVLKQDAVQTMDAYVYGDYADEEPFVTISDRFSK